MPQILQLKITLEGTKPPIWRRVLVKSDASFYDLHHIIQIVMGWTDSHMFEFRVFDYRIGIVDDDFFDPIFGGGGNIDASSAVLEGVITEPKEKFKYEYDFGDGWVHHILLEKILPEDKETKYPVCIAGKLNCPPEDCGGVFGFYQLLEIIKNKRHPDREDMLYWLGGHYDPDDFDMVLVNDMLEDLREQ